MKQVLKTMGWNEKPEDIITMEVAGTGNDCCSQLSGSSPPSLALLVGISLVGFTQSKYTMVACQDFVQRLECFEVRNGNVAMPASQEQSSDKG
eukprot:227179-Amphidinium_carterae.1